MSALLLALALSVSFPQDAAEKPTGRLTFEAPDGLPITAEYHPASAEPGTPLLVLFHQARSSRGEYRPMFRRLTEMGFNCLAVDLRSGGKMKEVKNGTNRYANQIGKGTNYVDALQDMTAALEYARAQYAPAGTALVAWGSSYSSSLVVYEAGAHPELIDGVISFAPGEYFASLGKSETWIQESAAAVKCPVFMTGARAEEKQWRLIFDALATTEKVGFVPETKGRHGSRALWPESDASADYWKAVEGFLDRYFPREKKSD
jgi:dienelactone hydrolase